jgi:hypothetical protein
VRQWQVAKDLIYGQVKKTYRRRKLVRVTHETHLGTQADLTVALQRKRKDHLTPIPLLWYSFLYRLK